MKIDKNFIIVVVVILAILGVAFFFVNNKKTTTPEVKTPEVTNTDVVTEEPDYKSAATRYCSDRLTNLSSTAKAGQKFYNNTEVEYLSFNFDQDADKEILTLCDRDTTVTKVKDYMALIVLDKKDSEYKVVYSSDYEALALEDAYPEGGYFRNLKIEDIDKDGVDEIVWTNGTTDIFKMVNIYNPKTNQSYSKTKDYKTGRITFSSNLTSETQVFKDYINNYSID